MNAAPQATEPSRIVLVVGVDMSEASEHLLAQTRDLIRSVDEAEVHVVHVVRPEPLPQRLVRPRHPEDLGVHYQVEYAKWALERLCALLVQDQRTRIFVHIPVGRPAVELARVADRVHADLLVVEPHGREKKDFRKLLRRSLVARIARNAPCTVLAIRKPRPVAEEPVSLPMSLGPTWSSAGT